MTKKDFILLADHIRNATSGSCAEAKFSDIQISYLAQFCKKTNPRFNENRWIAYINGACGPIGGKIKR